MVSGGSFENDVAHETSHDQPTRGCKIPKLAEIERLNASTSYTQIERLTSAARIWDYTWAACRDSFQ